MALRRCIKSESRSTTIVHYTNPEGGDFARITESHHSFRWTRAVALIAPPDDKRKMLKVIKWVLSDSERYKRIRSEVLAKGFQIAISSESNID